MKNLLSILLTVLVVSLKAQTTCQNAQPFCAGGVSGVNFPASVNQGNAQTGPFYGCLGSQPNPAWYYLQIGSSGNLDILIQGQTLSVPPGPGQDVDFICWGPFSSLANICNSLTPTNTVDCSYSSSFTETLNITSGVAGQYYLVLITNFANVPQNIVFNQFGGTGTTNCALVSSNHIICMGSTLSVSTSTPLGLTNVTYSLLPGNYTSNTPTFVVTPTANVNYTIYASGTTTAGGILTQSATSNVTVNPVPLVAPTTTNATCTNSLSAFNLGLTFNPASPAPGYTITWATIPNGILTPTQYTSAGYIVPGPYTATVVAAGGCSTTANFTVTPQPAPASFTL
jgi:hypothetical protein